MASNPEMPYRPNNVLDASYIRSELRWLKDGAFIKPEAGRPRTKGKIFKDLQTMTRPTILDFVPLRNRREYRDNILGIGQTPGGGGGRSGKRAVRGSGSAANRGVLVQTIFRPLERTGDLATIHSEDTDSYTGSNSASLGREEGSAMQGWSDAGSIRKMASFVSDVGGGNQESAGVRDVHEMQMQAQGQGQNNENGAMRATMGNTGLLGRRREQEEHLRPYTAIGLAGRRMAPVEVKHSTGTFEMAERPVTITRSLAEKIFKSRIDVVNL